jgi:CheY-like chemotaxis protein
MTKALKALLVDDDPILQLVVQKKLDTTSIQYKAVSNGLEAIEALKTKEFDFVLMDINMPLQDGLDAIRWLRDSEDAYYKNIPVFALTTYSTPHHTQEILEAGMNGHLVKPFELEKLLELLKTKGFL